MSVESDESIPEEGLMTDAKHAGREEEFFRINPGADPTGQLADDTVIVDNFPFVFVFLSNS